MQFNLFGRGLRLRVAITIACEMAFILFGAVLPYLALVSLASNTVQVTTKGSSPALLATLTFWTPSVTPEKVCSASSYPSTTWDALPVAS